MKRLHLNLLIVFLIVTTCSSCSRGGHEIYHALFGDPEVDCVKIVSYADGSVPVLDGDIFLHFYTCPAELKRILAKDNYSVTKEWGSQRQVFVSPPAWFDLRQLGDTILRFTNFDEHPREVQEFFISADSTNVFYMNLL